MIWSYDIRLFYDISYCISHWNADIQKFKSIMLFYVKELDIKPHLLRCGSSLSIQSTSACHKPRLLSRGGTRAFDIIAFVSSEHGMPKQLNLTGLSSLFPAKIENPKNCSGLESFILLNISKSSFGTMCTKKLSNRISFII